MTAQVLRSIGNSYMEMHNSEKAPNSPDSREEDD